MNDDFESALFEPVVILPAQMAVDAQSMGRKFGPIALMLAVLDEAARCIERGRRRRHSTARKLAAEAEAWVRSDSREWPFAFATICDLLGLDVETSRARFLAERAVEKRAYLAPAVACVPSIERERRHTPISPFWGAVYRDEMRLSGTDNA